MSEHKAREAREAREKKEREERRAERVMLTTFVAGLLAAQRWSASEEDAVRESVARARAIIAEAEKDEEAA